MSDHRAEAEQYLELARVIDGHGIQMAHHHALMAIGHALLAGPANHCRNCGLERQLQHEDWCTVGRMSQEPPNWIPGEDGMVWVGTGPQPAEAVKARGKR